jgi:hypothetical protein
MQKIKQQIKNHQDSIVAIDKRISELNTTISGLENFIRINRFDGLDTREASTEIADCQFDINNLLSNKQQLLYKISELEKQR